MKLFRSLTVTIVAVLLFSLLTGCTAVEDDTPEITVYNWGEYLDDEVLDVNEAFTKETGIRVKYLTFDSNESIYAMAKIGSVDFDVIIPSDYMIGKMIEGDMLAPLNYENIPNASHIAEAYTGWDFDPDNTYSVPYMWGITGIFYNKKYVDEADLKAGWDILWNEKYSKQILMFNNPRDAFAIAEAKLGYSINTTDEDEIAAAAQELIRQKPLVQAYVMDQVYDKMINEEAWLAPYYNGDIAIICDVEEGNPDVGFYIPEQTVNFFVDSACVSSKSTRKAEAEAYINFLCRTDVALANAEYVCYGSPHDEVRELLDPEMGENPLYYPDLDAIKAEAYITLPDATNKLMDVWWTKLKQ
ncbi:MAG: ABC transporter substrate-binding protein [Clostridia bacterium]|nr:ABC transporter substrate-binding protein [Clostridia bacterium]